MGYFVEYEGDILFARGTACGSVEDHSIHIDTSSPYVGVSPPRSSGSPLLIMAQDFLGEACFLVPSSPKHTPCLREDRVGMFTHDIDKCS